jgi:predicted esterase
MKSLFEQTTLIGKMDTVIFIGYSQGASMAWRALEIYLKEFIALKITSPTKIKHIAIAGDIPPELNPTELKDSKSKTDLEIHILRGERDSIYTETLLSDDSKRLTQAQLSHLKHITSKAHFWNIEIEDILRKIIF